eukprot:m.143366 g.143366  ORF g.143366 m.143366 type:complete len:312 (+) comp17696_c0_seq3:130-1065(+)
MGVTVQQLAPLVVLLLTATCSKGVRQQQRITLNTGAAMPFVNLGGTSQAVKPGNHYSNYSEFLRQGGRGIDTALTYTDAINEQIAAALKAHPEIPRGEIFLTTKVPCCPGTSFCRDGEYNGSIAQDMAKNNALLQVEYTDLTLLHHPCSTPEQTIQRYAELQDAMVAGHTKAIGVSNFNADLLSQLLSDSRINTVPAANQCNHAIGNHNASHSPRTGGDDKTVAFCKAHGISYSAYSPLEGLSGRDVFKIPEVIAVGKAHNVSAAQVALRWLVQQNITVVTAAHNASYIAEDIDVFSFTLTPAEMAALAAI